MTSTTIEGSPSESPLQRDISPLSQQQLWIEYQSNGASNVSEIDSIRLDAVKRVIGLDIEWMSETEGVCVAAELPFPLDESVPPVFTSHHHLTDVPYKPGFLGFREVDAYQQVLERIEVDEHDEVAILVDGNGILHPRCFGSASHLGVTTGLCTIGVAKHLHQCVHKSERAIKTEMMQEGLLEYDLYSPQTSQDIQPRLVGRAIRFNEKIVNPIYVSVGNRISLDTACAVVKRCMKFRIPEPTRLADIEAHRLSRTLTL